MCPRRLTTSLFSGNQWVQWSSMAFPWHTDREVSTTRSFVIKQERANSGISLASLEIRWRNERAINSTRNMILLLDTFHLFLNWVSKRVSDDQKYVCGCGLFACINTRKARVSIPEKLHHCQRSNKWFTWHVILIIAESKTHAHHKTHLHTMKVYNTPPLQFCWWFLSFSTTQ